MDRRQFLRRLSIVTGGSLLPLLPGCESDAERGDPVGKVEFRHGVASGDPLQDRVILWTRASPEFDGRVSVRYRVARDPELRQLLFSGEVLTDASRDYTVKIDQTGLAPGTSYYYQFEAGDRRSPVGRTRTLPDEAVEHLRLAYTSCSSYPDGYFCAYRHLAARADLDAVLHLGDYIYEYGGDASAVPGRAHSGGAEILTLDDYRRRYAQYRSDPDLQSLHRQHPMICVWDDHESANDAWRDGAENHQPATEGDWAARKAMAIQAYFEWLPIRLVDPADRGRVWRQFRFGDLVDLIMLDTRLYGRAQALRQALGGPALNDPDRQLLGEAQESWLAGRLADARATWKLIGQQVMFGQLRVLTLPEIELLGVPLTQELLAINPDQWDGYPAARQRVFDAIDAARVGNVVVLTGDIHSSWGIELYRDPGALIPWLANAPPDPPAIGLVEAKAVEFVSPSVTSTGFPAGTTALLRRVFALTDPHIRYFQGEDHGYVLLDITRERCQAEWWYVDSIVQADAGERFGQALYTRAGENRLRSAAGPSEPRSGAPPLAP